MKASSAIVVLPEKYEGPVCPCGQYLCQPEYDVYCSRSPHYIRRGDTSPASTPARELSLVEQFDAKAAQTRADIAAEFQAFDRQRKASVPTKKELRRRARERSKRATVPAWLLEHDAAVDAELEAMRREED